MKHTSLLLTALIFVGCASGAPAGDTDPIGLGGGAGGESGEGGEGGDSGEAGSTGAGKGGTAGKGGSGGKAGSGGATGGKGGASGKGGSAGSAAGEGGSGGATGGKAGSGGAKNSCGDGKKNQASEQCDGDDLDGETCSSFKAGYEGQIGCKADCTFDTSKCTKIPACGDGAKNGTEQCDGTDLGGSNCAKATGKPEASGIISCKADCTLDTSKCTQGPLCGDGKKNQASEQCDGDDLGGSDCAKATGDANKGGILACDKGCKFDVAKCVDNPKCGDGKINNTGEQCDGADLGSATCQSALGNTKAEGTVSCKADCKIDSSKCTVPPFCGDGKKGANEACDGQDFGGATCESQLGKGNAGPLVCSSDCSISTAKCEKVPYCGDKAKNGTEQCEGTDLGGADCVSVVGTGSTGTLACAADCTFDVSQCSVPPNCGNGKLDPDKGEQCDAGNLNNQTCATVLGNTKAIGTLTCTGSCTLDSSQCTIPPYCGDGKLNTAGEECDDGNNDAGDGCDPSCKVKCFSGESKFGVNCYIDSWTFSSGEERTWQDAENFCIQNGGHLASIGSQEELQFVFDLMPAGFLDPTTPRWIGFSDTATEGTFVWTDGSPITITSWRNGEPNNSGGNEDCTEMRWNDGEWNDQNCGNSRLFVCEYPPIVQFP